MTKTLAMGVVILFVFAYGIYYSMQSPFGWPEEKNRFVNPEGFSIVVPEGWDCDITPSDPAKKVDASLFAVPKKVSGRIGSFSVVKLSDKPDLDKLIADSYEKSDKLKFTAYRRMWASKYDRNLYYYFENNGQWYLIALVRNMSEPIDRWWQPFIESFKIETPRAIPALPSSQPTN